MTRKDPFQLDHALLAKLTAEFQKADSKAFEQVDLLLHMLEHHGVQELVRIDCPPPLIAALSRYLVARDETAPAGRNAFVGVIEQLTELNLSNPEWDAR